MAPAVMGTVTGKHAPILMESQIPDSLDAGAGAAATFFDSTRTTKNTTSPILISLVAMIDLEINWNVREELGDGASCVLKWEDKWVNCALQVAEVLAEEGRKWFRGINSG